MGGRPAPSRPLGSSTGVEREHRGVVERADEERRRRVGLVVPARPHGSGIPQRAELLLDRAPLHLAEMGKAVSNATAHEAFVQTRLQHPALGDFDLRAQFQGDGAHAAHQHVGATVAVDPIQQDQDDHFCRSQRFALLVAGDAVEVLDAARLLAGDLAAGFGGRTLAQYDQVAHVTGVDIRGLDPMRQRAHEDEHQDDQRDAEHRGERRVPAHTQTA